MAPKRSRRDHKRAQEKKKHIPPHQLLQQGRQKLEEGDPRQALDYFKRAQREDSSLQGLNILLFCAYSLRAQQLGTKGMTKEAVSIRNMAEEQRAGINPQALSADDFVRYIRHLETAEAIQVYVSCLEGREPSGRVEQVLADHLVVNRCWEALAGLDENHPLRRDAEIVKQVITTMDQGDWEQAGAALAGIARRSPFAPWRLFCKAMACFDAKDDRGLKQALDLLPKDFVLSLVADALRCVGAPQAKGGSKTAQAPVRQVLGMESPDGEQLAAELVVAIRRRPPRFSDIERLLPPLAKAIYPEDPIEACVTLLEIIGVAVRQNSLPLTNALAMQRLLPQERALAVAARIELINQETSHEIWHVAPAATYLAHIEVEFPEAHQQALARARVLEFLARSGYKGGACPHCVDPQVIKTLWGVIGERFGNPEMIFADLMLASLEADPDHREGYRFLLDLLQGDTSARPKLEKALNDMAVRFPDDPTPCLELALLHYSRNAYRKAEASLEEARKRAPHDERILDSQAIGYLKSADQSRSRRNYRLAEQDIQRAELLGRRRVAPVLLVKRLGLELISSGPKATAEVGCSLASLPPLDQLRSLALLILDLAAVRNVQRETVDKLKSLLNQKKDLIDQLSGGEVVNLLAPIEADFKLLFSELQVAPVLADCWVKLMTRVEGDDLIALFDILLGGQNRTVVRREIDRRLAGVKKSDYDPLLRFYLAVVRHLEGETYGSQSFRQILDGADSALKERLRAAAARLAPYVHGPLQEALRRFEFDIMDSPFPFSGAGLPGTEGLMGELTELIENSGGLLYGVEAEDIDLDDLENIIDEAGLRGAPLSILQDFVGNFRSDSQRRRELDQIARAVEDGYDDLSRELRVLLFPKRRGSRRATR